VKLDDEEYIPWLAFALTMLLVIIAVPTLVVVVRLLLR
jgi:hypothetical protein